MTERKAGKLHLGRPNLAGELLKQRPFSEVEVING